MAFDIVGDIHGYAETLTALLEKLGYQWGPSGYAHATRRVIFLGDFVDRGPYQREVIEIVRKMVATGNALAVMGNHEYNAIAYHTADPAGGYLRQRNEKNRQRHQAFLAAYEQHPQAWRDVIEWLQTLPLWLDLEGLRVVHACWDKQLIERIELFQGGSNLLTYNLLVDSCCKGTWQYEAIETLLKGKELVLPGNNYFIDKENTKRHAIRVKWWDQRVTTFKAAYIGPETARTSIPDDTIEGDHLVEYSHQEKPVFLGHYWLDGPPRILADNIACVDFSVAKEGGYLAAYRWDGEAKLSNDKFVAVKRIETG